MNPSESRKIRLVISEDVAYQLESVVKTLRTYPSIEVVGQASNPDEALEVVTQFQPDVVLFDLHYTGWDEDTVNETIRDMRRAAPNTWLLGLTAYSDLVAGAKSAGCDRVMLKEAGVGYKQVYDAIVKLGSRLRKPRYSWGDIGATRAEVKAFMAYVRTGSKEEAADARQRALSTQKNQEQSLRDKMADFFEEKIPNTDKAITIALRYGLIDPQDLEQPGGPEA